MTEDQTDDAGWADALPEGQRRFAEEYAVDPNATRAYRRSHPHVTPQTAATEGCRLLRNPKVRQAVAGRRAEYAAAARVSAVRVLEALAAVAFLDPTDLYEPDPAFGGLPRPKPLADVPPPVRRALQAVKVRRRADGPEVKYIPSDKLAALRMLAEHLGLFDGGAAIRDLLDRLARPGCL